MSNSTTNEFRNKVYEIVSAIPMGRVVTYGDVAICAGHPRAARVVGQIAHFGHESIPWHRVVNRFGGLAQGYWGGREVHKQLLEQEGVPVDDVFCIINFQEYKWQPPTFHLSL